MQKLYSRPILLKFNSGHLPQFGIHDTVNNRINAGVEPCYNTCALVYIGIEIWRARKNIYNSTWIEYEREHDAYREADEKKFVIHLLKRGNMHLLSCSIDQKTTENRVRNVSMSLGGALYAIPVTFRSNFLGLATQKPYDRSIIPSFIIHHTFDKSVS